LRKPVDFLQPSLRQRFWRIQRLPVEADPGVPVQTLAGIARFIHAEMQAQISAAGVYKTEQDQRTQVTGVARAQAGEPQPPAHEPGNAFAV
jgi:hypothetical protein